MESILISDTSGEFFYDDEKLVTLNNIKTVNIFIGANNSRKSRLVRKLAQIEVKVLVTSDDKPNEILKELSDLTGRLTKISKENTGKVLLVFNGNRQNADPTKRFPKLREFFEKAVGPEITFGHLLNAMSGFRSILNEGDYKKDLVYLKDDIERLLSVTDFLYFLFSEIDTLRGSTDHLKNEITDWPEENAKTIHFRTPDIGQLNIKENIQLFSAINATLQKLLSLKMEKIAVQSIYIPVLRSSRLLINETGNIAGNQIFATTIAIQYFGSAELPKYVEIHTGQNLYDRIDRAKRGNTEQRKNFTEFEKFIGMSFYQSPDIEIVAHRGEKFDDVMVNLPEEQNDIAIHHLGDGVQAIINLFFPIFTAETGAWIFIDEPELNLHPGFQNVFIRTLLENDFLKRKNLKYFLNTHSNHLLSEALLGGIERSEVYVLAKRDKNSSNIIPFEGFENATLDLLGVLNTSTLISNCSVWVEGVTDRLYVRAFLMAYLHGESQFQPIEGLNFSFIEYGGKNLVHYDFVTGKAKKAPKGIDAFFINRKVFLLADTDSNKDEQHEFYRSLISGNFLYEDTGVPEIENLLPKSVLKLYLQERFNVIAPVAEQILTGSYEEIKLGEFLAGAFKSNGLNRKIEARYGGTLSASYKSDLASFVLQGVQTGTITWGMLSDNKKLVGIVERLYQFIAVNNNRLSF